MKETEEVLNKMKNKYKLALFMVIRNSMVLFKGIKLHKSGKEINQMAYQTMCEVLTMIDYNKAKEFYKIGLEISKQRYTPENYIPIQKVKDKIEELSNTKGDFATYIAVSERIKALQELLEGRK